MWTHKPLLTGNIKKKKKKKKLCMHTKQNVIKYL